MIMSEISWRNSEARHAAYGYGYTGIVNFVLCTNGTRISQCYHVPRCGYLIPGDFTSPFGHWVSDEEMIRDDGK
jgi:hypothetical protein